MKKTLALITTVIFLISLVPMGVYGEAAPIEILNMDFNHPIKGQMAAATFSAYSDAAPTTSIAVENSAMKVELESEWSNDNGVKTDVTDAVKKAITSGDTVELSYSVQTWAWKGDNGINQSKGFLLVGDTIVDLAAGPEEAADGDACVILGSNTVEFGVDDKIYLCFTHGASTQVYDDIVLTGYKNEGTGGGDDGQEWEICYDEEFVSEGTKEDTDWVAGNDRATAVQKEWGVLVGNDDGASYEITDLVKGGMQLKVETAVGVNTDKQKITASVSVIKNDVEEIYNDGESQFAVSSDLVNDSWGGSTLYNPVSFTATLPDRISASAKVYVNISFPAGYYKIDFVKLYANSATIGGGGEEAFTSLKSAQNATGSFFPPTAKTVLLHDFGAEGAQQLAQYTAYKTEFSSDPAIKSGAASFAFASDWSADNGVTIDLTEVFTQSVPVGTPVRVSFSIKANYWGTNPGDATVDATFNMGSEAYKVISFAPSEVTTSLTHNVSGVCTQGAQEGDSVKLSITQKSGGFVLDNIRLEIPYDTAKVYDIAVASDYELPGYVYVSYGDSDEAYEADVKWEDYDGVSPVVYGLVTGMEGVKAKAIITSSATLIYEQSGECGVTSVSVGTDAPAQYDKALVVDNLNNWNIMSSFKSDTITAQPSLLTAPIKESDNNDGTVTIEGSLGSENASKNISLAVTKGDKVVWFNQVLTAKDGTYKVNVPLSETGNLTVYAGNLYTGKAYSYTFPYASSTDFNGLKEKIAQTDDLSTLFETGEDAQKNRDILGATLFPQFDTLTNESDKSFIYAKLKREIPSLNRADAASLFDGYTALTKINSDAKTSELVTLLEASDKFFGIQDAKIYSDLKSFDSTELKDVLDYIRLAKPNTPAKGKDVILGSALSVGIKNAPYYTEAGKLLSDNSALFTPYGVNVTSLSMGVCMDVMEQCTAYNSLETLAKKVGSLISADSNPNQGPVGGGGGGGGGAPSAPPTLNKEQTTTVYTDTPNKQVEPIPAPPVDDGRNFSDLTEEVVWAIDSINNLAEAGILSGFEDGTFRPRELVTREEFVAMLAKALGAQSGYTSDFWDVPAGKWSYDAVSFAYSTGIVKGMGYNYFGAAQAITRQDLAVMTYMALWQSGKIPPRGNGLSFSDSYYIANYAADAIASLNKAGIITGKGDNRFAPGDFATRAEAAVILERIIQYK